MEYVCKHTGIIIVKSNIRLDFDYRRWVTLVMYSLVYWEERCFVDKYSEMCCVKIIVFVRLVNIFILHNFVTEFPKNNDMSQ